MRRATHSRGVRPALQGFYSKLDDEQKARLLRDMATPAPQIMHPGASDAATMRTDTVRDDTRRPTTSRVSPTWGMLCEHMTGHSGAGRSTMVERNVRLSEGQRGLVLRI